MINDILNISFFDLKRTERVVNSFITPEMTTDLKECNGCNVYFDAKLLSKKNYYEPYLKKGIKTGFFCDECLSKDHVKALLSHEPLQ